MRLVIKNIGKIKEADITVDGITVIAGFNDTGKSTVGKSLYAIFHSLYRLDYIIKEERESYMQAIINSPVYRRRRPFSKQIELLTKAEKEFLSEIENYYFQTPEGKNAFLLEVLSNYYIQTDIEPDEEEIKHTVQKLKEALEVSDEAIHVYLTENFFDSEFRGQINNVFNESPASVELWIKEKPIRVIIENNHIKSIEGAINLNTEAIYVENPFVINEITSGKYRSWQYRNSSDMVRILLNKVSDSNIINEIVVNQKLERIFKKLETVCEGDIVYDNENGWRLIPNGKKESLDIRNLSAGLKVFVIIRRLLESGGIEENGTLILDEPEIHLHPEWQMIFAEIIVLLQVEFGLHILLNTHSPYFLRAIQVYTTKYGIDEKCKYYLSEMMENDAIITDVTSDIDKIYAKLYHPLQELENRSWTDD